MVSLMTGPRECEYTDTCTNLVYADDPYLEEYPDEVWCADHIYAHLEDQYAEYLVDQFLESKAWDEYHNRNL